MTRHILSIRHGAVLEARLNRPEKMNALTGAMYGGIVDILEQASSSNSIRAVLLTTEGSTFTAGNVSRSSIARRPHDRGGWPIAPPNLARRRPRRTRR